MASKQEEISKIYEDYFSYVLERYQLGDENLPVTNIHGIRGNSYEWDEFDFSAVDYDHEDPTLIVPDLPPV